MKRIPSYPSLLLSTMLTLLLSGAKQGIGQTVVITDSVFTTTEVFNNMDTLILDNCTFDNLTGTALRLSQIGYVEIINAQFSNITNTNATRAAICGRGCEEVLLQNIQFTNIIGTAIRFPNDGTTDPINRTGFLTIDQVTISNIDNLIEETGNAIRVFHTDSLVIKNCAISDVEHGGIWLGRTAGGTAQQIDYVDVNNNTIDLTLADGILAGENILSATIRNNTISNIAYDGVGARLADGDHGIYWQAPGVVIEGNTIFNNGDMGCSSGVNGCGNGISIRTNGKVLRNEVHHCSARGITYYNDHPGSGGNLEVSNNVIYDNDFNGIYITATNNQSQPDSVFIYHNTVYNEHIQPLLHHSCPLNFNSMTSFNRVIGNIFFYDGIADTTDHIHTTNTTIDVELYNLKTDTDPQFADFPNRDFSLMTTSPAFEYLPGGYAFVDNDFNNVLRIADFDAGAFESSEVLPVEYVGAFRALPHPGYIELVWQTASEVNNAGFTVERSVDGTNWQSLQTISGQGSTQLSTTYRSRDMEPVPGRSYYRLRQEDYDGQYNYSSVVSVWWESSFAEIRLFPNPTKGGWVMVKYDVGPYYLDVFDLLGKRVMRVQDASTGETRLDLNEFQQGVYTVQLRGVTSGLVVGSERLVVE